MKLVYVTVLLLGVTVSSTWANCESGECSWYGTEWNGEEGETFTACGTIFNSYAMEVAHKSLPCGTAIRVRNKNNGKTVDVKVSDSGPFVPGRILGLTFKAFDTVQNWLENATFPCDYEILN